MATLRQLLLVRRPPATSAIRRQLSPAAARWRLAASAGGYNVRMDMQSLVAPIRRPLFRAGGLRGAAPRSKFALQRQPSVRQAAFEHLATPMPFTTGSFRACASGSRTANNGVHQLSLLARKIM